MKTLTYLTVFALAASLFSSSAVAQASDDYHPFLSDKFNIGIGMFFPKKDFTLRVDGAVPEEEIDFQESLALDDSESVWSLNFRWRFGEKWSFWGQYWSTESDGGAVLTEDVEWQDVVFKEGTFATGGVDLTIARTFFGRSFTNAPNYEFGAGAGLHWMEIGAFIEGEIIIDENTTGFQRESVSADFPLPNVGAWYMYSWNKQWLFQARVDWLSVSIGDYSGGLWNAQVGIHWQAFKNIGFGLTYNAFELDVDVDKSDWRGSADISQNGPFLAVTAAW
jgi:hypothetical protein